MVRKLAGSLAVAALLLASPALAQTVSWRDLARAMAAPWPALQRPTGNLPDYLDNLPGFSGEGEGTRYGDALMGYALIQTGLRESDHDMIHAGIRAVTYATDPGRIFPRPSVFETMGVASAYNLAREQLPADPVFSAARAQWERWLERAKTVRLAFVNRYGNHWLVDAISVLELQRTGLHSRVPGSVLGSGATTARRQAIRLINIRVPRLVHGSGPFVLSDPPDNPLAYHGLSLGLYARAIELLGPKTSPAARRVLRQAVRASALLTAPDGDVAYFGRSQEEVWALPATAYGAELMTTLPGESPADDAAAHALAERAIARVDADYPIGDRGIWITPALAQHLRAGGRALDGYAGAPSMGGLALVMLNWTLNLGVDQPAAGVLPADHALSATASEQHGRFAVVRNGATWFAVKMTHTTDRHHADDLRYDAGLVIAERREQGSWTELVPERPRTVGGHEQSAAPVLLTRAGPGFFGGHRIGAFSNGLVRVVGGFRTASGQPLRAASLVYRPVSCGVTLAFHARRGDVYAMSAFFASQPQIAGTTASDSSQSVTVSADSASLTLVPGTVASGTQARLFRVAIVLSAPRERRVGVRFCAA